MVRRVTNRRLILGLVTLAVLARLLMFGITREAGGWRSAIAGGAARVEAAPASAFELSTTAFPANGDIPARFTCEDADLSPALSWSHPPPRTGSFTLITEDPDAPGGTFVHWILFDLPATTTSLPEGVPKDGEAAGGRQGRNGFGKTGYNGPCPPPGRPHRYFFRLYALDTRLALQPGATKDEVVRAMKGHMLSQAELMGRFQR
jgi:Raf kinase inhibitor-like YbhB/YbcL family protein